MFGLFLWLELYLLRLAEWIPLGVYKKPFQRAIPWNKKYVLLLGAHPDDASMSFMPLVVRFQDYGYKVVHLALTIGSPGQEPRRAKEQNDECAFLDLTNNVLGLNEQGLLREIKSGDSQDKQRVIQVVTQEFLFYKPSIVVVHGNDTHPDHIAAYNIVNEVLRRIPTLDCVVAYSEFWGQLEKPNVQVEVSLRTLAHLLKALSFHKGELSRNPYHLLWPLMLMLNRMYSEKVLGWGKTATSFSFSALYEIRHWTKGQWVDYLDPMQLPVGSPIEKILPK